MSADLSPCVRIFIESLVNDELTSRVRSNLDSIENPPSQNQSRRHVSNQCLFETDANTFCPCAR